MCRLPPPSSLEMLIPANAAGKVIGKGGANIANIRKVGLFAVFILQLLIFFQFFYDYFCVTMLVIFKE